ncbi:hypothetical protein RCL_jg14025.t1 [Rhizophagus clarus]|uniref:Uncharacterized protein n=1 Tax=Rhizophagus clarus TaxID=94130 RepID=A0A8H3LV13_9GLOM|nr:hypothetical protein RCL_jg14025.t1 [Rhizophagus clarus]
MKSLKKKKFLNKVRSKVTKEKDNLNDELNNLSKQNSSEDLNNNIIENAENEQNIQKVGKVGKVGKEGKVDHPKISNNNGYPGIIGSISILDTKTAPPRG